jgi:hypothetical protein
VLHQVSKQSTEFEGEDAREGQIFILYNSKKHPIDLAQVLELVKAKTKYRCSMSTWEFGKTSFPIVRVETKMPLMIISESEVDAADFVDMANDKALSKEEAVFVRSCNAKLQVTGAGNPSTRKVGSALVITEPKYAPNAKDTQEVVKALLTAVEGIGTCTTDGSWIRK